MKEQNTELPSNEKLMAALGAKDGITCSADDGSVTIIVDGICYSISPWGDSRGISGLTFDNWKSDIN